MPRAAGRPALVGFLTAGFPTRRAIQGRTSQRSPRRCDVVEIGVPFSDPMADGSTIQRASFVALAEGVTLPWILEELSGNCAAPRGADSVDELSESLAELRARAVAARRRAKPGVCGFIVPDLPYEESDELKRALDGEVSP